LFDILQLYGHAKAGLKAEVQINASGALLPIIQQLALDEQQERE
jgi:hypothetical protein